MSVLSIGSKAWYYSRWFVGQLSRQFREDGCTTAAAALTFTTMIAVVPFVAVIYRILSLLPEFATVGDTITSFIFETFLPGSTHVVLEKVREFAAKANELTIAGVGIVFLTTMFMLVRMENSFNRIWHVTNTRTGLSRFLSYWGIVAFGIPLIGVSVILASYDFTLSFLDDLPVSRLVDVSSEAIPPFATALTFTLLYYAVPSCRVQFLHALFGGAVTTVLLTVAKELFTWAVPFFHNELVYGAFAVLPLFVMGLYLVWVLILIGALCTRTLSLIPWEDQPDGTPVLVKCTKVLAMLHQAHLDGLSVTDADMLRSVPMTRMERARIFDVLQENRLIGTTNRKDWTLGRSLESMTLWELFVKLPDGIERENVGGVSPVEACLRAFLDEGVVHLNVTLEEMIGSQTQALEEPTS